MKFEIIREIKNSCSGNQKRDVFLSEENISNTDAWIKCKEPFASEIIREEVTGGVLYFVYNGELLTQYSLSLLD